MPSVTFQIHTKPDDQDRQSFTAIWTKPCGDFRSELSPDDGKPVGRRRAQCFFANVAEHALYWQHRGYDVEIVYDKGV